MTMRNTHIVTLYMTVSVFLFEQGCAMRRLFARDSPSGNIFRTFSGISILECEGECARRRRCADALYNKRASLCQMRTSVLGSGAAAHVYRGMVLLYKPDTLTQPTSTCGEQECKEEETCTRTNECEVTECGPPSYSAVKGNLYTVNNSVMVNHGTEDSFTLTCSENGTWVEEVMRACPAEWTRVHRSCYILPRRLVTWQKAQKNCEALDPRAHLAYTKTKEEMESLLAVGSISGRNLMNPWLGGQIIDGGQWRWGDGTLISFWNWAYGKPTDRHKPRCLYIFDEAFHWADQHCSLGSGAYQKGLCELELSKL